MSGFVLFTDVSLDPQRKSGVGGYLILPASVLEMPPQDIEGSQWTDKVVLRRFEETSSTQMEVRTILWALEEYRGEIGITGEGTLQIYSDSQCVTGLLSRRSRLEENSFLSGKTGRPLKNAAFYRAFYRLYDELHFEVIKVRGHSPSHSHDTFRRIFSVVDKTVRRVMKCHSVY